MPAASCTTILADHEWKALYTAIHRRATLPATPYDRSYESRLSVPANTALQSDRLAREIIGILAVFVVRSRRLNGDPL
jgi:hypothetical protein